MIKNGIIFFLSIILFVCGYFFINEKIYIALIVSFVLGSTLSFFNIFIAIPLIKLRSLKLDAFSELEKYKLLVYDFKNPLVDKSKAIIYNDEEIKKEIGKISIKIGKLSKQLSYMRSKICCVYFIFSKKIRNDEALASKLDHFSRDMLHSDEKMDAEDFEKLDKLLNEGL